MKTKPSALRHPKVTQIVCIDLQGLLPGHVESLLFDKGVLDVLRLCGLRKDGAVVDGAAAKLGHLRFMIFRRRTRWKVEVFHMEHRDTVGMVFHDLRWLCACHYRPSAVEFKSDLLRVCETEQFKVRRLSVGHDKLGSVVVITEVEIQRSGPLPEYVELLCVVVPVVQCVQLMTTGCSCCIWGA